MEKKDACPGTPVPSSKDFTHIFVVSQVKDNLKYLVNL